MMLWLCLASRATLSCVLSSMSWRENLPPTMDPISDVKRDPMHMMCSPTTFLDFLVVPLLSAASKRHCKVIEMIRKDDESIFEIV